VQISYNDGRTMKIITGKPPTPEVFLPNEIVHHIVSHLSQFRDKRWKQYSLYACCLVSRQWYIITVPFLYKAPYFYFGRGFNQFITTICPPVAIARRKKNLGSFVRYLSMRSIVHHSSNSVTARLISRVKENLETFAAPRVSFS
jgi:hypothetical protein